MKNITSTTKDSNSLFTSLSIVENGLILKNKKKEESTILYSELSKIYIKRCQLSLVFKLAFILIPLFLTSIFVHFFPIDMLLFVVSIPLIPLFVWVNNYKWYELNILLNDGAFYIKKFYIKAKYEHINLVNGVKKEIYEYQIECNYQFEKSLKVDLVEANYSLSTLSIA
jgi:hypothetical protein